MLLNKAEKTPQNFYYLCSSLNPDNAVLGTEHYRIINLFFRVLIKLHNFNISGIIVTEHLRTGLNTAHAERTGTNINIRFFHFTYFLKLIINYDGIPLEDFFSFRIKLVRNLVDLELLTALLTLHADFSACPYNLELSFAILARHPDFCQKN